MTGGRIGEKGKTWNSFSPAFVTILSEILLTRKSIVDPDCCKMVLLVGYGESNIGRPQRLCKAGRRIRIGSTLHTKKSSACVSLLLKVGVVIALHVHRRVSGRSVAGPGRIGVSP